VNSVRALAGIDVLDLSYDIAGQFCGRLFADNGARVSLFEPPEGSPTRRIGPFVNRTDRDRDSCLFWHLNLGKRSISIDLEGEDDVNSLRAWSRAVDVIVVDSQAILDRLLADDALTAVICCITPFGRGADWRGSEMVYQAVSGCMFENGRPDLPPLYGVGHRASYAAGTIGYVECLALLYEGCGRREVIDVSIAETAASMNFCRATQYSYNKTIEDRAARTTPRAIVRCADGWATVFIYDHRWRQSCMALGLDDLMDDPRFTTEVDRLANWEAFTAELQAHLRHRRVDDVLDAGQREKAVVARGMKPSELRDDTQLLARSYWDATIAHPEELPRLGPMFRFSVTAQVPGSGSPTLHAHAAAPEQHRSATATNHTAQSRLPLSGVIVLDLTTAWSGPMTTRILAALGADVLKVEGPGRIDDWRGPINGGLPSRYPGGDAGVRPYNRCFQFNTQNHDKRVLALDLKTDEGLAIARSLAAKANVLIANFSAGTLERMGLGWTEVQAINPRLIQVEMPAYGTGGPITHHVALGPSMEFMNGMAMLIGYGDGAPVTTGPAYMDPVGGFNAAAAVLTALVAQKRLDIGQYVEVAQREASMHWIGEEIIHAIATQTDRTGSGSRLSGVVPHDAFPCLGRDEWVVIAAHSDAEFASLCTVMGRPDLARDPLFTRLGARAEREDELYALIAAWTATRGKHEVAICLQAHGVHAAPVCHARDLAESTYLRTRGFLQTVSHPEAGVHTYQGLPLHIDSRDLSMRSPAPCFGRDTDEILSEKLGLTSERLRELRSRGIITEEPRRPAAVRPVGRETE
jgi:crotonobetainyl-CoA:carnitine CoA-transferase CaiB-like acyl-CoA transferase